MARLPKSSKPLTISSTAVWPEVYMIKAAVLRRHLSDDQRASIASLWKEENKEPKGKSSPNYGKSAERVAVIHNPTTEV